MTIDTDDIDFDRAGMLLDVVHKCATVGPKLTSLGNAAMTELTELNDAIRDASRQRAEKALRAPVRQATHVEPEPEPEPELKLGTRHPEPNTDLRRR